jgi:hypothetical protein
VKHVSFNGVLVFWKVKNYFFNFSVFVCYQKSYWTENTFQLKKNLTWFLEKCFPFILGGKQFLKVVKNLEISYYLLIISNLVLKLLIAIYILFWIFDFQFHPLEFNFYINFDLYFYNCYLLFPYYFLIEIFYLSNLVLILLIVTYFIWNNLWNGNYYYFNFFIFQFSFYFLDLIFITLQTHMLWPLFCLVKHDSCKI